MTIPEGAQLSEDGYYWWDGSQWQPVPETQASYDPDSGDGAQASFDPGYADPASTDEGYGYADPATYLGDGAGGAGGYDGGSEGRGPTDNGPGPTQDFGECMRDLGIPIPDSWYGDAGVALAAVRALQSALATAETLATEATLAEVAAAVGLTEVLSIAGGLLAAAFIGACLACLANGGSGAYAD
ncbi:MAG TPA: hypothetical protein VGR06_32585 [Actinophytocola sp.]|jgi:hypothetical protein|uniref:hypothetical protein n=1 Tax=Actinophytocola sp. TaxID=1872138 RepID=UPI002E0C7DBE|nr:hypothetical protein [Actinophytocola sp.]